VNNWSACSSAVEWERRSWYL